MIFHSYVNLGNRDLMGSMGNFMGFNRSSWNFEYGSILDGYLNPLAFWVAEGDPSRDPRSSPRSAARGTARGAKARGRHAAAWRGKTSPEKTMGQPGKNRGSPQKTLGKPM